MSSVAGIYSFRLSRRGIYEQTEELNAPIYHVSIILVVISAAPSTIPLRSENHIINGNTVLRLDQSKCNLGCRYSKTVQVQTRP